MSSSTAGARVVFGWILRVLIAVAIAWAIATALGAGFSYHPAGIRLTSREPVRPLALAAILAAAHLLLLGGGPLTRAFEVPPNLLRRFSGLAAIAIALVIFGVGLRWCTRVAGGSDAYGYVSQADLWVHGELRVPQSWAAAFDWPDVDWAFTPLGYRPAAQPHVIVPTYPAGMPMLMAVATLIGGADARFLVVPLFGGLAVFLTYRLGRRLLEPPGAFVAAMLVGTSPSFLRELMVPTSDVAATALWTAAALLALGGRRLALFGAGLAASAAIAVRPNLILVAAALGVAIAAARPAGGRRAVVANLLAFVAGLVPGGMVVAGVNWYLYGSPFRSGYGDAGQLYAFGYALTNARRYTSWLWETHTPLLLIVPFALARPRDILAGGGRASCARPAVSPAAVFYAVMAAVPLSYVFYLTFGSWTYLRFLLPAFPVLAVAGLAGLTEVCSRVSHDWRATFVPLVAIAAIAFQARVAIDHGLLTLGAEEQRYVAIARAAERLTPANAMLLSMQHSGTLRYYAHRLTLRYDHVPPGSLGSTIASLQAHGYRPYLVLDDWEVAEFRARFGSEALGPLGQKPLATVPGGTGLYDPLTK